MGDRKPCLDKANGKNEGTDFDKRFDQTMNVTAIAQAMGPPEPPNTNESEKQPSEQEDSGCDAKGDEDTCESDYGNHQRSDYNKGAAMHKDLATDCEVWV